MAVIPAGYGQASINFTGVNVPNGASIVIGFRDDLDAGAAAAAEAIFNATGLIVDNMCTSDVALTSVDVKLGPNDTGAIATYSGTPIAGAVGATSLSPGSAILIEKQTGTGGRRGRGRAYWPGVYDGWVDDNGALGSGIKAQVDGFMDTWEGALTVAGTVMVLLHSPSYTWTIVSGQPRRVYDDPDTVPAPYVVTDLICDPVIATQRRRLR